MNTTTLPEVPPVLSAEQMNAMTDEELAAESERRYQLYNRVDDIRKLFTDAWLSVANYRTERVNREKIRAEVIAEMQKTNPAP
jgi:hypothetical protein